MKVSDIMQKSVVTVSEDTPVRELGRLIFTVGIAGVPVVRGKKLVGIVTEQDILSNLYPTIQELVEDSVHAQDFSLMEENINALLFAPVKKIMNTNITTISADTPLLRAQSLMLVNSFSRIPIVDKNKNLVGIISQGDIFRQILKNKIPEIHKEKYAGFIARHYDLMVDWEKRFKGELPALLGLFKKEKVKNIVDLGTWTGTYTTHLARKGFRLLGLDHNLIMVKMSEEARNKLPAEIKKNVKFILTDFKQFANKTSDKFDAAICMGNSLPYIPVSPSKLFTETGKILRNKNAVVIIQLLNFEKLLKKQDRLLSFQIQKSNLAYEKEHLFLEFFDKKEGNTLLHNTVIFDSDGENWIFKGIMSFPIFYITKKDLEKAFRKAGFKKISFSGSMGEYQGEYGRLSFTEPFKPLESDWLIAVAKR